MARPRSRTSGVTDRGPVPNTTSGYGPTRSDSVGFNPANPQAYVATQAAKAYKTSKGTKDWDGDGISPPIH